MQEDKLFNPSAVDVWLHRIQKSKEKYKDYHELIDKIRNYYKNDKNKNINNLFWSSIETLKPFLYFKTPKPYVERKDKSTNQSAGLACKIMERALDWNLSHFDFDSVIKYARNDFLLVGMGVCYEKYQPVFKTLDAERQVDIIETEQVDTVYVSPKDFLIDTENVNVWEDVSWIARKINMTVKEAREQFGDDIFQSLSGDDKNQIIVYEIWDKTDRTVKYLTESLPNRFLKIIEDYLHLDGFFPFPKPIFATLANDGLVPVPDFVQIRTMLNEMDGINERMRLTMKALKVSGVYDNSFSRLADIFEKDVTLVSIPEFDRFKEVGGIRGAIDFIPITQYVEALQALVQRREDLSKQIYEITGVSDIMRGTSNQAETATAVTKKTNFGTLRNQDRQNDMLRFITDLLRIKAEMICELFSEDSLRSFLQAEDLSNQEAVDEAIRLLKTDKLRGMILGIETDISYQNENTAKATLESVTLINEIIIKAFEVVSNQPLLLPLYQKMLESIAMTMPTARQYEPVIGQVFKKIETELKE